MWWWILTAVLTCGSFLVGFITCALLSASSSADEVAEAYARGRADEAEQRNEYSLN